MLYAPRLLVGGTPPLADTPVFYVINDCLSWGYPPPLADTPDVPCLLPIHLHRTREQLVLAVAVLGELTLQSA